MPRSLALPRLRLHDLLARAAARFPEKPATLFEGATLTYRELQARVEALAGHLQRACGVRKGERVLLDLQNGPDFVVALFAILRADAVAVPVSPANVAAELRHYIEDCGTKVALAEQAVAAHFATTTPRPLLYNWPYTFGLSSASACTPATVRTRRFRAGYDDLLSSTGLKPRPTGAPASASRPLAGLLALKPGRGPRAGGRVRAVDHPVTDVAAV